MKPKSLIKLAISLLLLAFILRFVNFHRLLHTLATIPSSIIIAIVFIYAVGQLMSTFKWWMIARAGGIDVSYFSALKAYFIGMFVNCFGLGLVGGDVARGILISYGRSKKAVGLASVIADRAQGLAVLAIIGMVAATVFGREKLDLTFIYLLWGVAGSVIVGWFFGPKLLMKFLPEKSSIRRKALEVSEVLPRDPKILLKITIVSIFFHLLQISLHRVMGLGLGVVIPWRILLVTIPFVNILSSLPISWNGLGVRENSYLFFLVPAVLTREQAVAMGALWLLSVTLTSAVGGIVALVTRDFSTILKAKEYPEVIAEVNSVRG